MKKFLLSITLMASAAFSFHAEYKEGYYSGMDGKRKEALKSAAKACVQNHTRLDYYQLPNYWVYTDIYPELYDGMRRWWEMYSNNIYLIHAGQSGTSAFSANKMQREHAVPKSWWKKNNDVEYTPAYTDMWNLYPSDPDANMAKSNYPLGPVKTAEFDNGLTKVGPGMSGFGGGSYNVFEPGDEYKGDFARAFFYMATVYDELPWAYTYMYQSNTWPTLRPWAYEMLLDWARKDPVSQKETDRNDAVEKQQGNRNPFIDFPQLAEYIWGTRTGDTFYIADQQSGVIIPPIDGDPEITKPESGLALDFGQAATGSTTSTVLQIQGKNLTEALSIRVTGSDRAMFIPEVTSIPASTINSRDEYLLPIVFAPTSTGEKKATLVLYDGGLGGGNNITVQLIGEALEVPVLTPLTAYEATEITEHSYVANWSAAPEVVDYYVIDRVRYYEDGSEGELLESDTNSALITGRDPAVMESYTVFSSRLGYLSEASNSILVMADSGVRGIDDTAPLEYEAADGEIRILGDGERDGFILTDTCGRILLTVARTHGGETYRIPASGVLFLRSAGKTAKIIL